MTLKGHNHSLIAAGAAGTRCFQAATAAAAADDDDDANEVMSRVVDWLPRAWQQVNAFLEAHSATINLTIGIAIMPVWSWPGGKQGQRNNCSFL